MLKRFYTAFILISFLFILCNFQCDKGPYCEAKRATKTSNTFILPTSSKYYQVGDTITLNTTIPYSKFNDLTIGSIPIQRYFGSQVFEVIEITGGSPYNAKFAGDKFDVSATRGSVYFSGAGYVTQTFSTRFESDSLSGQFISELKFVARQAGRYLILDNGCSLSSNQNPCTGNNYEILLLMQWGVTSRNTEIPSEAGITGDIFCKDQNGGSGFFLPTADQRIFYFYVQ